MFGREALGIAGLEPVEAPASIAPGELERLERLRRWNLTLRPPRVRRLRAAALEYDEIEAADAYRDELDPGESEVLAIARQRGWVAVLDEQAGHQVAGRRHR